MFIKQYIITHINHIGEPVKMVVIASSKDEAIDILNINIDSIVSVSVDYQFKKTISTAKQIQILTRISGCINSGQSIDQYLLVIVDDFNINKHKKNIIQIDLNKGEPLSRLLLHLDIHSVVCSLIENGEISDNMKTAIIKSKQFLKLEERSSQATSGSLKSNLLMLLTAVVLIFGFPIFIQSFFKNVEDSGLTIPMNISTDILFFLANYGVYFFVSIVIISIAIFLKPSSFLSSFGHIYPVSIFNNIIASKQSVLFINIYAPLYEAKMTIENIINSYQKINIKNAKNIKGRIESGISISEAVQNIDFSKTFKLGFKGFSAISNKKAKIELLEDLSVGLNDDIIAYSKQANKLISSVSYALMAFIILILLHGFVLPQMSLSV